MSLVRIAFKEVPIKSVVLTITFVGIIVLNLKAGETCGQAIPIIDGAAYEVHFTETNLNNSWYTFIATDPDFQITINQLNGDSAVGASFGRFTITIFGAYGPCDEPCVNLVSRFSEMFVYSDISWGIHEFIESYEISSNDLQPPHSSFPVQYFIKIESSFGIALSSNMTWSFDMVGTSCCWPEEPSQPSLYAYCDNFYNLTPGLNQSINFPVSSTGVNEFWMASTSPAGLQLPAGSLEFSYAPGNSDDPCAFNSSPANSNQAIRIEQYGPFDACSEPCEQFNLNPVALDTISPVNYGTSGFDIGTFSIPSGDAEQLWLYRIIYEVKCAPCEFALSYDLTGAISGFSTPDDLQAPCTNCLPVQGLLPEKKYIVTAWVKDADIASYEETIEDAEVKVVFDGGTVVGNTSVPSGPIIDGWQQIECEFTTPQTFFDFNIELNSLDGIVYFDDVRLFPYDGSMKCYVYDPQNLRFVAELDERHFATLYEYDEEGRLMRIKKETERGVMTIQESKTSTVKRANVPD
jgi:hypothetical protein